MEYSLLLNIINKDIEEENERISEIERQREDNNSQLKVNLPSHLKS